MYYQNKNNGLVNIMLTQEGVGILRNVLSLRLSEVERMEFTEENLLDRQNVIIEEIKNILCQLGVQFYSTKTLQ